MANINVILNWLSQNFYWQYIPMLFLSVWFALKKWITVPPNKFLRESIWSFLILGVLVVPIINIALLLLSKQLNLVIFTGEILPERPLTKLFLETLSNTNSLLIAPLFEELFFRVFLFGVLLKLLRYQWIAMVVCSLIFGMIHPHVWLMNIGVVFLGLACNYVYTKYGFWSAFVMHSLCNFTAALYGAVFFNYILPALSIRP